jgi:predicted AAA+ superfamily ATPase
LKDLRPFQQFLVLLAGRIGQTTNYTSLSNDVGVSPTTVKNWISVLKASFMKTWLFWNFSRPVQTASGGPICIFFRDSHGNEVDLLIRQDSGLVPIEIKSAVTFTSGFMKGIERFREPLSQRATAGFVLSTGAERFTVKETQVLNPIVHSPGEKFLFSSRNLSSSLLRISDLLIVFTSSFRHAFSRNPYNASKEGEPHGACQIAYFSAQFCHPSFAG